MQYIYIKKQTNKQTPNKTIHTFNIRCPGGGVLEGVVFFGDCKFRIRCRICDDAIRHLPYIVARTHRCHHVISQARAHIRQQRHAMT